MKKLLYILLLCAFACITQAQTNMQTINYSYDANSRLTSAYYTRGSTNMAVLFAYDLNNNRTERTDYGLAEANGDLDGDDLADTKELSYFGDLSEDGTGDPDGDGLANSNEFDLAGNPTLTDTDADGQGDFDESIAGTPLNNATSYFAVARFDGSNGQTRICYDTVTGRTYQVQHTVSPRNNASWTNLGAPHVASASSVHCEEYPAASNAYYRVQVRRSD